MIDSSIIILCTALYLAVLFFIAYRADKKPASYLSRFQPLIYTLSLTVYCTSWTFYGAVGNAAVSGWDYFSIYLGPIIVFVFFFPFIKKLIAVSKRHKTTTIADFIATRYGKSNRLAAVVTLIAFLGSMPYIALQIKAISNAYDTLAGIQPGVGSNPFSDTAFALSIILTVFAILFGARTIDASEQHKGILHAIGFESIVKLVSFVVIAILAYQIIEHVAAQSVQPQHTFTLLMRPFAEFELSTSVITKTILAASAILLLPRQFHVLAVEARGGEDASRWGLPLYLLLFSLAVVPITAAGKLMIEGSGNADLYVLLLPMVENNALLSILSYLGGFSAATGMVIVATIALSTMVSNDLIFPFLVRVKKDVTKQNLHSTLLLIRRATILMLMLMAYGYYYLGGTEKSLQSVGLISFAAAIQFLPSVVGGLYWSKGHRNGALAGLIIGFVIWFFCLLMPSFANSSWMPDGFVALLSNQDSFFNPHQLFGIQFSDPLTHGVFWSLLLNIAAFILFSFKAQSSLTDRLQASSFVGQADSKQSYNASMEYEFQAVDLFELCARFTGEQRTRDYFAEHGIDVNHISDKQENFKIQTLTERLLAGSIGTATAEHLIRTASRPDKVQGKNLYEFIDQTGQAIEFNRELLQVTLDHIGQAVSVVDSDLRLVAWNRLYIEFFKYPTGFIRVGKSIEEVIRFNVNRNYGPEVKGNLDKRIKKRLKYLRHGDHFTYVRDWQNGKVIQTEGARLPEGGYITTYTDITPLKKAERTLAASNENLEAKVTERTEMLSSVNQQLEQVVNNKTHFLAAASHDLLQPIGASKLYLGALMEDLIDDEGKQGLAKNALGALRTAESLLKSLLNLSKLDSGILKPDIKLFPIQDILKAIANEFAVVAERKKIHFKVLPCLFSTASDKSLLLSILQNLVANAVRYTETGSVLVVCRRVGNDMIRIEVRDSGPGIPLEQQDEIFDAFKQLEYGNKEGAGLGLTIGQKAAELLNHDIKVNSKPGLGSTFSVKIPRLSNLVVSKPTAEKQVIHRNTLQGLNVICVDDDPQILKANETLLQRWGVNVTCLNSARQFEEMEQQGSQYDVVLMDYQLGDGDNGLTLLERFQELHGDNFFGVLVTAEQDPIIKNRAKELGFGFLAKPVEPAKFRSLLQSCFLP